MTITTDAALDKLCSAQSSVDDAARTIGSLLRADLNELTVTALTAELGPVWRHRLTELRSDLEEKSIQISRAAAALDGSLAPS